MVGVHSPDSKAELEDAAGAVRRSRRLAELSLAFLRLGCTSFGGPVAHLGYFREEFVVRRKWLGLSITRSDGRSEHFEAAPVAEPVGPVVEDGWAAK